MMFDFGQTPRQIRVHTFDMEPSQPFPAEPPASIAVGSDHLGVSAAAKGLTKGWLIEMSGGSNDSLRRFLQIGTGQWCGAEYATLFPLRRTAIAYAREFGLLAGHEAQIVPFEQGVTCG